MSTARQPRPKPFFGKVTYRCTKCFTAAKLNWQVAVEWWSWIESVLIPTMVFHPRHIHGGAHEQRRWESEAEYPHSIPGA